MSRVTLLATLMLALAACAAPGGPPDPVTPSTDGGGGTTGQPAASGPSATAALQDGLSDGTRDGAEDGGPATAPTVSPPTSGPGAHGTAPAAPADPRHPGSDQTLDTLAAPRAPLALPFTLRFAPRDAGQADRVTTHLEAAGETLQRFFGFTTGAPVTVTLHPDRAAFDASFPPEWGLDQTACWMVASGVAGRLDLLSPRVWRDQACEHDPDDEQHLALLLTHELVHVVHGERNPTGDFTGAEELGWFAEGLATYASGQLDGPHADKDREALEAGAGPTELATAWSGPWRYGVCGSLVRHIDRRLGRPGLVLLLAATDNATLLAALGTDEATLLADWRAEVLARE